MTRFQRVELVGTAVLALLLLLASLAALATAVLTASGRAFVFGLLCWGLAEICKRWVTWQQKEIDSG